MVCLGLEPGGQEVWRSQIHRTVAIPIGAHIDDMLSKTSVNQLVLCCQVQSLNGKDMKRSSFGIPLHRYGHQCLSNVCQKSKMEYCERYAYTILKYKE